MLTYNLDSNHTLPAYEYIYKCIKEDIINGILPPHYHLPSKRSFAKNLGVSIITVQNGYEQLLYEGYIYSIEKRGYFVSEITDIIRSVSSSDTDSNMMQSSDLSVSSKSNALLMDFTKNHDISDRFPFSIWAKLTRRTLLDNEDDITKRTDNIGLFRLRCAIANHLKDFRGLSVNPANIVIGAGTEYLYSLTVQLLGRSRMMAVEDPGHTKIHKIYEANGIKVLHVPVDSEGVISENLQHGNISAVHLSPTHHYPTGVITSAKRRHKILTLAEKHDFYVIEDDYDSEFHYEGRPIPAMAELNRDRVIYMNTFSKSLMESLRIAYMVLPDRLMKKFNEKLSFYSTTVSGLEQYILSSFISEGYFERHINRTRLHYKKCRNLFLDCFKSSELSKIASIEENGAGLHFIIKINKCINEAKYLNRLLDLGISVKSVNSYSYHLDKEMENCYIINYFHTEANELINAFNIMATLACELGK